MSDTKHEDQKTEVTKKTPEEIIMRHVGFGMVAGAVPFPIVDIAAVTAIQMDMLRQLSTAYEIDFNEERGKSLASALITSTIGTSIGRLGASVVKTIPGIGTLLGVGSQVVLSGASTYAIGKIFQTHYEKGGSLFDFDVDKMKAQFEDFFQIGKTIAEKQEKATSREDILETINKLKDLADGGVISKEEFEKTKKELLEKLSR